MNLYLAGPGIFFKNSETHFLRIEKIVKDHGHLPSIPYSTSRNSKEIFKQNLWLLNNCDAVVADVTPFRGPSVDVGTTWEIGYAFARGKPVYGYGYQSRPDYAARVRDYEHEDRIIEDFGLFDNLMIAESLTGLVLHPNSIYRALSGVMTLVDAQNPGL